VEASRPHGPQGVGVAGTIGCARTTRHVKRSLIVLALLAFGMRAAPACQDFHAAGGSRWTVESRRGVSWLRTPCGDSFFSIGVNNVNGGRVAGVATPVGYRWDAVSPDFASWLVATRGRLAAWGFNTASGGSLAPDVLRLPALPDLEIGRTARFHWVDPFDPASAERVRATARELVARYRGNPYRIGYFTDNEVGWWNGALFAFYLQQGPTNHSKRRLVALLREHYGDDWERFTRDFVPPPGVASFDDLLRQRRTPSRLRPGGRGIDVVRRWTAVVAERYYRVVGRALREADPDALVFGDRLPIYYDPGAVRAMAPYVDVITTNYNVDSPDGWIARYYFDGLRKLSGGKPVLVSEWFFAADENRTGNRNNGHLMTVRTQAERARGAAAAAERFAREPSIIGTQWFQYYDHPRGGRADGEDYDFGLVDVDDRPYEELVAALAGVNAHQAELHRAGPLTAARGDALPEALIDPGDRSLAEWPKESALISGMMAPAPEVPFADLYVAWDGDGLSLAVIGMDYHAPELLAPDRELPPEECFHVDWGIEAGGDPHRFALYFIPPAARSGRGQYEMRVQLCRTDAGRCDPVRGAVATYFGADQPRLVAEARLPWAAAGVTRRPPDRLRMELAVTAFHRSRWMSTSGHPPAATMQEPGRWRLFSLGPR